MNIFDRFKSADDKTSVLFHNNLCRDKGSLTVTVYNSGMLIAELMLQNKKTTMTVVFGVGFDGVNIDILLLCTT